MKGLCVALTLALTLALSGGAALAGGADFIMGGPTENVNTLFVVTQNNEEVNTHRLSMQKYQSDTGPGYIFTLSPIDSGDPCRYNTQGKSVAEGVQKTIHMSNDGINTLYVQINDLNQYNKTHHLTFTWDDECQLKALVFVEPN